MTAKQYNRSKNVLTQEMQRVGEILYQHALNKEMGLSSDNGPLIQKTYKDLLEVLERIRKLEKDFWGKVLADVE